MIERELVERVLADPEWTRAVVEAAARAANTFATADLDGRTPDGDDAAMSARTQLGTAFVDAEAIRTWRAPA